MEGFGFKEMELPPPQLFGDADRRKFKLALRYSE